MASSRPLLIVDDDAALRQTLAEQLSLDGEFSPAEAETAKEAEEMLTGPAARAAAPPAPGTASTRERRGPGRGPARNPARPAMAGRAGPATCGFISLGS